MLMKKKVVHHKAAHKVSHRVPKHLDPGTFMLLAVVVVGLLVYFAMQSNMPLASFLQIH